MYINGRRMRSIAAAILVLFSHSASAESVEYLRDVKPILKARCFACHGALKQESGLRLDAGSLIRLGGDNGPVITPDAPRASPLLKRVSAADLAERMPPEGEPLTPAQIESLTAWIAQGAPTPENEQPEDDPRAHWAFQPLRRPDAPFVAQVANGQSPRLGDSAGKHPIDAFIEQKLKQQGLKPRPPAPKHVLLRRVYLDLIGLPPTGDALRAFLADESPDAYENVIARLLDDPRHGERWGRHWMDVWRYSDWYGRRDVDDVRNSASQIYRWRDWIVQSLNQGKGYDRMIQEMLAADEICPEDYEAGAATGYLIRNYYSLNPNDWMRSAVEHTGKAFLGLTFNCAHCHDHKYDPIGHDDYFRLRAFFEPVFIRQDRVAGEADPGMFQDYSYSGTRAVQRLGMVRVFDRSPDAPTWFYTGGDERNRVTERGSIPPGVPAFLENAAMRIEPVELPPRAWYPGLRAEIQEAVLADASAAVGLAETELAAAKASSDDVPAPLRDQLAEAQAAYAQVVQSLGQSEQSGALVGRQSLLLDATGGRRIVQNRLSALKALDDGATLSFQLMIWNDAQVNFQLVNDVVKGLTAGYVAFEGGRIMSYQPETSAEFEVGRYDLASGQSRFVVQLVLQTAADRCLLTIRSVGDGALLADAAPIALNGWNPVGQDVKAISFDARTGSMAAIDAVEWTVPAADAPHCVLSFDFEPPAYAEGRDAVGIDGWEASSYCVAPATSVVSRVTGSVELRAARQRLALAERAVRAPLLRLQAADARLVAAQAERASVEARIAADRARYGETPPADVDLLIRAASQLEREAALKQAESDLLAAELALLEAELKPADDAERGRAVGAATDALAAAGTALNEANQALANGTLAETYSPLSPVFPRQSTGRRRALAAWIVSRDNPLTARVAVNHLWTRHFRAPLVASVYDFGRNGARPTHPDLLDWLAVEFMESGWDMKRLHRLMVTSDAYRRVSSVGDALENATNDPENKLLWRMNASRMEAEVLRDSLLYCAEQLDATMGGVELENSQALTTNRRSLYYSTYPEAGGKSALGELFDAPDPLDCYRRASSIVPQQALALTNSDLVHRMSAEIVRVWQNGRGGQAEHEVEADEARFVVAMFERILSRGPTDAERRICGDAMQRQRRFTEDPESAEATTQARESLVRILLNHNDFVTVR